MALAALDGVNMGTFLLLLAAWLWLVFRLNQLESHIEAACSELQIEMAELVGNQDRADEILRQWNDQAEKKKANRTFWIVGGIMGAGAVIAWLWYIVRQHY